MDLSVQDVYKNSTVFLTGTTGFVGKLVLEKLLACTEIKKAYLLIRMKKNKSPQTRLDEIFASHAFDNLRDRLPELRKKISLCSGDLLAPRLGLSDQDAEELIKNVNYVLHSAATTKFDEDLPIAARINVVAVKDLLEMAKKMPNLKGFVHVSTAYSNCARSHIAEEFYQPGMKARNFLGMLENLDDGFLKKIEKEVIGKWPNTYTFTKAVAEDLIKEEGAGLPIAVVRPSIVTGAVKHPLVGFVEGFMGTSGICCAMGLGLIRISVGDVNIVMDIIPVDFVVNNILAAGWHVSLDRKTQKSGDIPIYNCVSSVDAPMTLEKYSSISKDYLIKYPLARAVFFVGDWYPILHTNRTFVKVMQFLLHTVPAHALDFLASVTGDKPRLVAVYQKMHTMCDVLEIFMTTTWTFTNDNAKKLTALMSPKDREMFCFDSNKLDIDEYIPPYLTGCRQYLLNEPLDTVPEGKKRETKLKMIHHTVLGLVALGLFLLIRFFYLVIFRHIW